VRGDSIKMIRTFTPRRRGVTTLAVAAAGVCVLFPMLCQAADEQVPLPLKLPEPLFPGTPEDFTLGSNVEPPSLKPRPIPKVPKGTVNLALKKKVTASSTAKAPGSLDRVTDGNKEARDDTLVELKKGLQWVQIDLGAAQKLLYVVVWHMHQETVIYHDVIVQVSNDPDFIEGVTTLYNSDSDNSAGLGIGKNREYIESYEGRLIAAKEAKARYVRLYSQGSTYRDSLNRYTEVEVYGLPAK